MVRVGVAQGEVLEVEEVAVEVLRRAVPAVVVDLAFPREALGVLEFQGPDRRVGECLWVFLLVDPAERDRGLTVFIVESLDVECPARIMRIGGDVLKDIAAVVEDNVQQHIDSESVSRGHEIPQFLAGPKPRINVEEVLHAVAMIRLELGDLFEDRSNPQRRHAQSMQTSQLGFQTLERAADEDSACRPPFRGVLLRGDGVPIVLRRLERWCGAGIDGSAIDILVPLFVAVGEAVWEEEVEELVLPRQRRWMECLARRFQIDGRGDIRVVETFGHVFCD